jgi:hypothetical protein
MAKADTAITCTLFRLRVEEFGPRLRPSVPVDER